VSLSIERIWNGLWPLQVVVLTLLALGVSGLLPVLGPWLHSIVLTTAAAWLLWTLWVKRRAWRVPTWNEASRRLEQDSGVEHRPLQGLDDEPLKRDATDNALWQAHQRQLAARLAALKPKPPESDLPRRDRFAFRAGGLLALIAAVFLVGDDAFYHLGESVRPSFAAAPAAPPVVDVWVEPPEYTRAPPLFAQPDAEELAFPANSTLVVRVNNAEQPLLLIDAGQYMVERPLEPEAEGRHTLRLPIQEAEAIVLQDDENELAAWSVRVVPDKPPMAELPQPPSATERGATRIDYTASDDYGVTDAWAELRLIGPGDAQTGETMKLQVLLGDRAVPVAKGALFQDLTPHRWAGRQVQIRLFAVDAIDQQSASNAHTMVLPERIFEHPVAQAIIEQRKRLDQSAPFDKVARGLYEIAARPLAFDGDVVVFLGLSTAFNRLRLNDSRPEEARTQTQEAVRDLLWDVALRVEEGGLPAAERELRAAQRALQEALARDAPDEEIARLVERLRQAMREFAREMAQRAQPMPEGTMPEDGQEMIRGEDLEQMLDRIQELSETGAREAAQQLLSQLQQMTENMQAMRMSPQQQQQAAEMMRMMNQLDELRRQQQELMDETFRQNQQNAQQNRNGQPSPGTRPSQQGQRGQQGQQGQPMPGLAQKQEELRRQLGELMRQMGEGMGQIPQPLQDAEQAMRGAGESLQQGDGQGALGAEGEALQYLESAAQQMANQLSQQMGVGMGPGRPGGQMFGRPGQNRTGRDPLGREEGNNGQSTTEGAKIPEEFEIQRAREIRDELYRRSADPDRPQQEQEYLRRLLERF